MVAAIPQVVEAPPFDSLTDQIQFCLSQLKNEISNAKLASDTAKKIHAILELLIQYILANTTQNADKSAILNKIEKLLDSIESECQLFQKVKQFITAVENNPKSWNADLLAGLKELATELNEIQ